MRSGIHTKRTSHRRQRKTTWFLLAAAAAGVAAGTALCAHALAGTDTWTGGGADGNWQNASNWGGTAPTAGDNLIFAGSTNLATTNNFPGGTVFNSITFDPTAGAFTLANNSMTLGGNITDNSTALQTISLPIALSASSTFTAPTTGNLAISSVISASGAQGITQGVNPAASGTLVTGAGTTTLTGQNTFTGPTKITSGVLALDYNAPGAPSGGNTILNSASTLTTGGRGALLVNGHASNATVQSLNGLTVNANTNSNIIVNTAGAATTVNLGAISGASAGSVDFQNFANTTTTTTTPNSVGGIMGALYTAGTGAGAGESWAVSAASGGGPGAITPLTSFDTTFTPNTNEDVSATTSAPAGPLTLNSLRISGAGALTLTLGGDTTLTSGGLLNARVQSGNGPVVTGGTITSATGVLVINNRTQDNFSVLSKLIGNMNLVIVNQQTAASSIDPGDNNNDNNDGSVILNSSGNSFTGTITVAAGRLQITGQANSLGNAANPINVVGGLQGGGQFQDNNVNLDSSGTHTITISGLGIAEDDGGAFGAIRVRNKLSSPIVLAGTSRIGVGVNAGGTFAGAISGNFELWLDSDLGTRPLVLANSSNTWDGGTRIERGTVQMGVANALPQSTIITFGSLIPSTEFYSPEGKAGTALFPTLNLNGFNTTIGGAQVFGGDADITGEVITNNSLTTPATLTVNSSASTSFSGLITNTNGSTLSLVKSGTGTFTLSSSNTYTGSTTVNAGRLRFFSDLTSSEAVTLNGGTLELTPLQTRVLRSPALIINGGRLDIQDNKLIATATPAGSWTGSSYTDVTGMIASGRGSSNLWEGAAGIVTGQSAAVGSNYTTIGIATASDVRPATATATDLWAGQTITGTDTLVMYTYGGDATLDGKINVDDYIKIDTGIAAGLTGWSNGDFNYDGKVNIDDYTQFIDANIATQGAQFPTASGFDSSRLAGAVAVPEPSALLCFVAAAPSFLRRRRPGGRRWSANT